MDLCYFNPATGIKRNPEKSRTRFLHAEELPAFFKALEEEQNEIVRDFILIALLTGARRSNVQQMRWEDISFTRKEWLIPRTKNDEPQILPLCSEAMAILQKRKVVGKSDYVFPGSGRTGYFIDPKKGWARVLKQAGLKNLRLHDLRRTLGGWQAKSGTSLIVIGKSLGHTSVQATAVYARLDIGAVRDSVEIATRAIIAASKKKKIHLIFNAVAKKQVQPPNFLQLLG